jgi:outer membrane protein TolC
VESHYERRGNIMKIVFCILTSLFIFSCIPALAEEQPYQEVTLDEYLDLVKSNHPFFRKERLAVDVEEKQAESLLGGQDWILNVTPSYSYLGEATAPEFQADKRVHIAGLEAGLDRALWSTGGKLGFSFSTEYINSDGQFTSPKVYKHGFGVSYTHPFLQNAKGVLDRLGYELSDFTIDLTGVQAIENQEDFLANVAIRYIEWAFFSEAIVIAKERLKLAEEQKEQTMKRFNANLVDRVDVLRAEDAINISKQAILQLESQWKAKQAELAVLAGSDEIYRKRPSYDIYSLAPLPQKEEASSQLKSQSRLLRIFEILRKQLLYQRDGLLNQRRAQLDLILSGGLFGRGEDDFGESLKIYKPDMTVSLLFSTPLEKRTINGQLDKLDTEIKRIEEDMKSVETNLLSAMVNLLIQIVELEKVLELNQEQINSAREKTTEEIKLYNQGRSQLTFVIQSRDNEENAKLRYAENSSLYHTLLLQYRALLDELLVTE